MRVVKVNIGDLKNQKEDYSSFKKDTRHNKDSVRTFIDEDNTILTINELEDLYNQLLIDEPNMKNEYTNFNAYLSSCMWYNNGELREITNQPVNESALKKGWQISTYRMYGSDKIYTFNEISEYFNIDGESMAKCIKELLVYDSENDETDIYTIKEDDLVDIFSDKVGFVIRKSKNFNESLSTKFTPKEKPKINEEINRSSGVYLIGFDSNNKSPSGNSGTRFITDKSKNKQIENALNFKNMYKLDSVYALPYVMYTQKVCEMGMDDFYKYVSKFPKLASTTN